MPLSLSQRPLDWCWIVFFVFHLLISLIMDVALPLRLLGFTNVNWPQSHLAETWEWWTSVDHLMGPEADKFVWIHFASAIEFLVLVPFLIAALYAFYKGKDWIRIPCVIFATIEWYSTGAFLTEELFGSLKTSAPLLILAAYVPFIIVPILLIARMWRDEPFEKRRTFKRD